MAIALEDLSDKVQLTDAAGEQKTNKMGQTARQKNTECAAVIS
jgi:hypothetical protein